jgi:Tol biopolymer transport system component
MTPDGSLVALATGKNANYSLPLSGQLYVWDSGSASIVYSLTGSGDSFGSVAISPNGQKVAYITNSAGTAQLMVLDWALNTNRVIASYQGNVASSPRFSADSRFLAYVASVGSPAYINQVFLYDFQTGTNLLVSQSYDGVSSGNDQSDSPDISTDGKFICYRSAASNLILGDTNEVSDIFLYDRTSGSTTLITASRFGGSSADNRSFSPVFSGDGRTLIFESRASDLIPNDFNNNNEVFALGLDSGTNVSAFAVSLFSAAGSPLTNWLSWPIVPGKTYRAQFKQNLDDSVWQDLSGQMSIMGDRGYLKDAAPVTTKRFYRIVGF